MAQHPSFRRMGPLRMAAPDECLPSTYIEEFAPTFPRPHLRQAFSSDTLNISDKPQPSMFMPAPHSSESSPSTWRVVSPTRNNFGDVGQLRPNISSEMRQQPVTYLTQPSPHHVVVPRSRPANMIAHRASTPMVRVSPRSAAQLGRARTAPMVHTQQARPYYSSEQSMGAPAVYAQHGQAGLYYSTDPTMTMAEIPRAYYHTEQPTRAAVTYAQPLSAQGTYAHHAQAMPYYSTEQPMPMAGVAYAQPEPVPETRYVSFAPDGSATHYVQQQQAIPYGQQVHVMAQHADQVPTAYVVSPNGYLTPAHQSYEQPMPLPMEYSPNVRVSWPSSTRFVQSMMVTNGHARSASPGAVTPIPSHVRLQRSHSAPISPMVLRSDQPDVRQRLHMPRNMSTDMLPVNSTTPASSSTPGPRRRPSYRFEEIESEDTSASQPRAHHTAGPPLSSPLAMSASTPDLPSGLFLRHSAASPNLATGSPLGHTASSTHTQLSDLLTPARSPSPRKASSATTRRRAESTATAGASPVTALAAHMPLTSLTQRAKRMSRAVKEDLQRQSEGKKSQGGSPIIKKLGRFTLVTQPR